MHTRMYIETTAHAAHICTHLTNFLFFNYLSLFCFVCKIKKCVQSIENVCKIYFCVHRVCRFVQHVCSVIPMCAEI